MEHNKSEKMCILFWISKKHISFINRFSVGCFTGIFYQLSKLRILKFIPLVRLKVLIFEQQYNILKHLLFHV